MAIAFPTIIMYYNKIKTIHKIMCVSVTLYNKISFANALALT